MVFAEFFFSFVIAFLLTGLYIFLTRGAGRRTGLVRLFLIIFLATWAAGIWLKPLGPTLWGIHWMNFLLSGIVIVLLLSLIVPQKPPRGRHETLDMLDRMEEERQLEEATYIALTAFFWTLIFVLLVAILIRYITGLDVT